MTEYAEVNHETLMYPSKLFPAHKCLNFTYEYVVIYKESTKSWYIVIDLEASTQIFYCPFCGKELP